MPVDTPKCCDFFEHVGEKRIDIRQFLGYVCQIAKVSVRMSFGWVSLFAQKYVFLFLCAYARIDIKSDYQFNTFICFTSICTHIELKISNSIRVYIDIKRIDV